MAPAASLMHVIFHLFTSKETRSSSSQSVVGCVNVNSQMALMCWNERHFPVSPMQHRQCSFTSSLLLPPLTPSLARSRALLQKHLPLSSRPRLSLLSLDGEYLLLFSFRGLFTTPFSWPLQLQLFFLRQLDFFPPQGRIFSFALSFTGNSKSPRNVTSQKGKHGTGVARGQGGFREQHKRPRHHTGIRALLTAALLPACVVSSPAARWLCKRRGCLMIRRGIRSLIFATRVALNSFRKDPEHAHSPVIF